MTPHDASICIKVSRKFVCFHLPERILTFLVTLLSCKPFSLMVLVTFGGLRKRNPKGWLCRTKGVILTFYGLGFIYFLNLGLLEFKYRGASVKAKYLNFPHNSLVSGGQIKPAWMCLVFVS